MKWKVWYIVLILLGALPAPAYTQDLFGPPADYPAGDEPNSVFSADLDGDADSDLVVVNEDGVSVLMNNGDGTFALNVDYPAGDEPNSVFSADLGGDGDNDLVVTNEDGVSVLMNNGDGTFALNVDYPTGDEPNSVFSADLDGDGDNDLVVTNEDGVSVLLNNGDGTFTPKVDYDAGRHPQSVVIADLDGNGDKDLAVANRNSDNVSVLLNNGDGTFTPKVDYDAGRHPQSVVIADLDGDGDKNLAVANRNSDNVSVLLNRSNVTPGVVVTSINPSSGTQLGGTSVTITGGSFQTGATVTLGDSSATDVVVVSSNTITAITPVHPAGTVDVIVTNANGLSDTLKNGFEFTAHPRVTSINPTSGTQVGGTSVTITGGSFQTGATVTLGDSSATDVVVVSSNTITAITPVHPAGTVDVIVTNANGLSDTLKNGFEFIAHPRVTTINPTSGTQLGGTSVTITGSNFQSGATVTLGDSSATDVVVVSSNTITAITPVHLAGTVDVIVTNANGLSDTLKNGFEFIAHPVVTSINPTSGTELGGTSVTIAGSNFQSGAIVTFGDSSSTNVVVVSSNTITATTPVHPAGAVDVIVTNTNGLSDTLKNGFEFSAHPRVTSISPTSGTQLGGASVTIVGSNFQSGTTVTLGDSTATSVVVVSSDLITAKTPSHPAGALDVIVTNPNGLSDTLKNGFEFIAHPRATSINPTSGTELGGTSVTIAGSNFQSGATVTLGDSSATDVVVVSSNTITAITPVHPAGTVDVIVTNANGLSDTLKNGFEFIAHPRATSINPTSGTELGGTSVTIAGSNFQSGVTVTLGDSSATDVVVVSSDIITLTTSSHAAAIVDVVVTNANGLSDTLSAGFEFIAHPILTVVSPSSGTQLGGTSVTITGGNFQSGATVTFGDSTATSVVVVSSDIITLTTSSLAASIVDVIVTNANGLSDTLKNGFEFIAHPRATSISPSSGTQLGATSVTITGGNFQSGATVTFGDSTATSVVVVSSNTITATTPSHPAGIGDVIVTNTNGLSDTLKNGFEFIAHPRATSISPSSGTQLGATSVTITGSNFQSGATVTFGDSTATSVVVVSSNAITATTPSHPAGIGDVIVTNTNGLSDTLKNGFEFIAHPVVTVVNPTSGTQLGGTSVTITGISFQSGATVTFGDSTATDVVVVSSDIITLTTPSHPVAIVDVVVTNANGLSDTLKNGFAFLSHPRVTAINPTSGTELGGTSVTIAGSNFQSGATVTFGDSSATNVVVVSSNTITATTPAHPVGTVDVIVTNTNGLSDTLKNEFEFIAHPVVTVVNPTSGTELGGTSVTIAGSNFQSGATVTFGDSSATGVVVLSSNALAALTPSHSAGALDVIVTNPNGLSDTLKNGFAFIAHPRVTAVNPSSGTQLGGTSVTIVGSNFQSGATVTFGDSSATSVIVLSSNAIAAVTPDYPAGKVDVIVANPSGLSDTLKNGFEFIAHPLVIAVNPSARTELGGTSVTIVGSGFQSGASVAFGDSAATGVVVLSSNAIAAVTPDHPAGKVDVIVANPSGLSDTLKNGFEFIAHPLVIAVRPTSGTQLGRTFMTISGKSFQSGATVTFGDSAATNVSVGLLGTITAKTPAHPADTVDVIVTNANGLSGTLSGGFTFLSHPRVTAISPTSGAELGGTSVTIAGSNFQNGATVTFGDSTATSVVVLSSNAIAAVIPDHPAGAVDVLVTNPNGLSGTLSGKFTFLSDPRVTAVNPTSGTELGGTSVTIVGSRFQSGATVTLGDGSATNVVAVSDSIITAKTPTHPAGTVQVIVTNPDGQADTLFGGFTFIPVVPDINVSPVAIDFDSVLVGGLKDTMLVISNTGNDTLVLSTLSKTGPNPLAFTFSPILANVSGSVIAPGDSDTLIVKFSLGASGLKSATLIIPSNDPDAVEDTVFVSLSGVGIAPDINVSPLAINFDSVKTGSSSDSLLVIRNLGDANLTFGTLAVDDSVNYAFNPTLSSVSNSVITPGDSVTLVVTFQPQSGGVFPAVLTIPSNDPNAVEDTVFVDLAGVGEIAKFNISGSVKYFSDPTKTVPDIVISIVELPGETFVDSDTTLADGSHELLLVTAGKDYRATPSRAETEGAVTGGITINDAVFVLQFLCGKRSFNRQDTLAADVDGDLIPTINDPSVILQKLGGVRSLPFPSGFWRFDPPSKEYLNLSADQTGQDFISILVGDVDGDFQDVLPPAAKAVEPEPSNIRISLEGLEHKHDNTWTVQLSVNRPDSLSGIDLGIKYPVGVIDVKEVRAIEDNSNHLLVSNLNNEGQINVLMAGATPFEGDGSLVEIEFEIIGKPNEAGFTVTRAVISDAIRAIDLRPANERFALLPREASLSQNYPNPFNAETAIDFRIPAGSGTVPVKLSIYNAIGQQIKVLVDDKMNPGFYSVVWHGTDDQGRLVGTGVYFYRIAAGKFVATKKTLFLK